MTRTMSPQQRDAVDSWVRDAQPVLLLADWRVDIEHDPPADDDADAEISAVGDSKSARMRVSAELFRMPFDYQAKTLVHELLHLHFWELDVTVTDLVKVSGAVGEGYARITERQVHTLVDQLARCLTSPDPLPSLKLIDDAVPLDPV